jgi:3-isopropylmalate/(R)-2-methylmalate dehydratase small subunit
MDTVIRGRVWKYGDNVNTDVIFPGKYTYTVRDRADMGQHALEDLDPSFAAEVRPGDVIVAGRNWGCGSSREQAVVCLKMKGVGAIVAKSVSRIYYRNCINEALPALTSADAAEALQRGDEVEIDLARGEIRSARGVFTFPPLPEAVLGIVEAGGLIEFTRRRLGLGG